MVAISALLLVVFVVSLASSDPDDTRIGRRDVSSGPVRATRRSHTLLFQDLRGGDLHVWVTTPARPRSRGWVTFTATVRPDAFIERKSNSFVDCDGKKYPEDGGTLQRFHTEVDSEGQVVVDFTR